jgi:hypothetical protein
VTDAASDPFEDFELPSAGAAPEVVFGSVDATAVTMSSSTSDRHNDIPTAKLALDVELARGLVIDYAAPVQVGVRQGNERAVQFTGHVLRAEPRASQIAVELSSMPELKESVIGLLATWNVPTAEHFHVLTRSAGLAEEQINIHGLAELPLETFEVAAPVSGLVVNRASSVGDIRFVPVEGVMTALQGLGVDEEITARFAAAGCVALTMTTARRMLDAEENALAKIDRALSWLAIEARYGLSHWPNGTPRRFDRAASRSVLRREDLVWVRGLINARQWIRSPGTVASRVGLNIDPAQRASGADPPRSLTMQDEQALEALRRAAATTDPVQALTALWEAIEFHTAGISPPALFSDSHLKTLRKSVPKDLPPRLRGRAIDAINRLNEPPLLARLREAVEQDGVPSADEEWALLQRMRRARNASVHGANVVTIRADELHRAITFVARLLIFRAHRRLNATATGADGGA